MRSRLAIVASHVIQYQDPFFKLLAGEPGIDLTVIYCSRHGAETYRDEDMKTSLAWDIELLAGYRHLFLRNFAREGSSGFLRLVNPGIVPALVRGRYDAVIFMFGWGALTALLGMAVCWFTRTPFFLFGDSSFVPPEETFRSRVRAGFLRMMFALASGFMVSGKFNERYYLHYGASPKRFFPLPWAADNERFAKAARMSADERTALRARYGIAPDTVVIVYSGKLIPRKDPLTLLLAFGRMQHHPRAVLLFLGDGELREELERTAERQNIGGVHFAGFVNQSELPRHYAMGDIFVLPTLDDPRGTVVNEAMACGLPVISTDRCGAVGDIVQHGDNGFVVPPADVSALRDALDRLTADDALRARMSERSRQIIATWDFKSGVEGVRRMLRWLAAQ